MVTEIVSFKYTKKTLLLVINENKKYLLFFYFNLMFKREVC
jgi:hypothetical protein